MVATADQIASQAGMVAFHRGGNAVDAAIAANAAMAVTSPHLCGLGGDLFVLVHTGRSVAALNASGRSGSGADPVALRAVGTFRDAVPSRHPLGDAARLRRRLGLVARAVRLDPPRRRAGTGDPDRRTRFPGQSPARRRVGARSTTPPAPTSTRSPARRRTSGHSYADRESAGHCAPSPPTGATASTAASSRPACWISAAATSRPRTSTARRPTGSRHSPSTRSGSGSTRSRPTRRDISRWVARGWRASSAFRTILTTRNGRTC